MALFAYGGKGDAVDELCADYTDRMRRVSDESLSSEWYSGFSKYRDAEKIAETLYCVRESVAKLVRIHGVPPHTQVQFAVLGQIGKGMASKDGSCPTILLPRDIYDECEADDLVDVYCGIAIHEASHLNHSRLLFSKRRLASFSKSELLFIRLLEEERVERLARAESPGFAGYLDKMAQALFLRPYCDPAADNWPDLSDVDKAYFVAFGLFRFPSILIAEHLDFQTLSGRHVSEDLRSLVPSLPETEIQLIVSAKDLAVYWDKLLADYTDPPADASPEWKAEADRVQKEMEEDNQFRELLPSPVDLGAVTPGTKVFDSLHRHSLVKEVNGRERVTGRGTEWKDTDTESRLATEERKRMEADRKGKRFSAVEIEAVIEACDSVTSAMSLAESCNYSKLVESRTEFSAPWEFGGLARRTAISHPKINGGAIEGAGVLDRSTRSHVARMRAALQIRWGVWHYEERELSEGRLDRRRLGRASIDENIFRRDWQRSATGLSLCLLLDASGSMGIPSDVSSRARKAAEAAYLIASALKGVPGVELEIYSHDSCGADSRDLHIRYLYGSKQPDIRGIGNLTGGSQNYDHMAVRVAAEMFVKNTTNGRRVMFVLADGIPCGHRYGGDRAIEATRREVEAVRRSGIYIAQIAIENFHGQEEMYGRHVLRFTDLSALSKDMRKLVTRLVREVSI